MTNYIDTWLAANDVASLQALAAVYPNILGPVEQNGTWYACVRSEAAAVAPEGVSLVDQATAETVLGVWA